MVKRALGRALFFRSGLREHVRNDIEEAQRRAGKARAKLEEQVRQLQQSNGGGEKRLRRLERRYEDLTQKYGAAAELLGRQRERSAQLEAQVESFERARLEERVTTIERVRRSDQQEQLRGLTSELEALFPIPVLAAHVQQVVARSRLAEDPYPHSVLEDVLPHTFHTMLYESRPPERSWRGGREGRENWTIGEDLGPLRTEAT